LVEVLGQDLERRELVVEADEAGCTIGGEDEPAEYQMPVLPQPQALSGPRAGVRPACRPVPGGVGLFRQPGL
jgi:hypothetical protein